MGAQYGTVFEFPAVFHLGSRYGQYHVYAALPYIGSDQYPDHQAGRYFHKLYGKTGMVPAIVRDTGDLADVRLLAIIYIAAMMNIDPTLYEAAEIDGASRWTKMWRITLPCIYQYADAYHQCRQYLLRQLIVSR